MKDFFRLMACVFVLSQGSAACTRQTEHMGNRKDFSAARPESQVPPIPEEMLRNEGVRLAEPLPRVETALVDVFKDPANAELRQDLSALYRSEGFAEMAAFYAGTAAYLEGRPSDWTDSSSHVFCRPDSVESHAEALRIDRILNQNFSSTEEAKSAAASYPSRVRQAADESTEALQKYGPTCEVLALWADAMRTRAQFSPEDGLTVRQREQLARVLLTLATVNVVPPGVGDDATSLENLSYFYTSQRDYVSALLAAKMALKAAESRPADPVSAAEQRHIREWITRAAKAAEEQRLSRILEK